MLGLTFSRFCLLLLLWMAFVQPNLGARTAVEAYDSLAHLSSEQLMESGRSYFVQRRPAQALACFTVVSERNHHSPKETELCIRALNNCACVYKYFYFDYAQAYHLLVKAYDLCEDAGYEEFMPIIMLNMGDLLNDYSTSYHSKPLAKQAWQMLEQCMEKAVENKNWELMTTAFFNLANQNYGLNLEKYKVLFSKNIPETTPDLDYARFQYQGIGHVQKGEYEQARQCFLRQLEVVNTQLEPARDTLASYMSVAHKYLQEKNYDLAASFLHKALDVSSAGNVDDQTANICQQLSECYRLMGDEGKAGQYHVYYLEKKEQAHSSQLASIAELNYIHELKVKEEQAQQMAARQRLQQFVILLAFIVLLVVVVFLAMLWRKNQQLKLRNKSLYEKQQQMMQIEAEEQSLRKAYSKSNLNEEQRETLIYRIQETLSNADIICQQDFTLGKLAKLINSNTTYTSQVINEKYGMAFSNLLSSYRVKVACQRMNDPEQYGHVTIEAIATSTGFKSRTTFVNAFKRETGLTPSEYLRIAAAERT